MTFYILLELVISLVILDVGLIVYLSSFENTKAKTSFLFLTLTLFFWIVVNILADISSSTEYTLFFTRFSIIWTALIPLFFGQMIKNLYFLKDTIFLEKYPFYRNTTLICISIFVILNQTSLNVIAVRIEPWGVGFQPGILYGVLFLYLCLSFGYPLLSLYKLLKKSVGKEKRQLQTIIWGTLTTLFIATLMDIVLPLLGYDRLTSLAPSATIFFALSIFLSIWKYELFNMKVFALQLAIILLCLFGLLRVVIAQDTRILFIEISQFILISGLGFLLLRSVVINKKQREQIGHLSRKIEEMRNREY
jgi:hypothetical protein